MSMPEQRCTVRHAQIYVAAVLQIVDKRSLCPRDVEGMAECRVDTRRRRYATRKHPAGPLGQVGRPVTCHHLLLTSQLTGEYVLLACVRASRRADQGAR